MTKQDFLYFELLIKYKEAAMKLEPERTEEIQLETDNLLRDWIELYERKRLNSVTNGK